MLIVLKIYIIYDMFSPEAEMKDPFLEKSNNIECENTDQEDTTGIVRDQIDTFGDLAPDELKKMIFKNRKFFRISAELSVNSN